MDGLKLKDDESGILYHRETLSLMPPVEVSRAARTWSGCPLVDEGWNMGISAQAEGQVHSGGI